MEMQEAQGITPPALLNRPSLPQELIPVYNAYTLLNKARGGNMAGPQPIRISEIAAYLDVVGESCADGSRLMRLVIEMDTTYLEHQAKKAATK